MAMALQRVMQSFELQQSDAFTFGHTKVAPGQSRGPTLLRMSWVDGNRYGIDRDKRDRCHEADGNHSR